MARKDNDAGRSGRAEAGGPAAWLAAQNPLWRQVGRVTFHLAENKRDAERPLAFLATYTHRLSEQAKPQYLPLGRALQEDAGAGNRAALLTLLAPVQRAAEQSTLARELVESQRVFQPQTWTAREAHRFLGDVALCEASGLLVRIPDWWKAGRPSRPPVNVTVGEKKAAGLDALLDFKVALTLDGEAVTDEEWARIAAADAGLGLLRGKWVEVDRAKLEGVLAHWKMLERGRRDGGVSFAEGLRMTLPPRARRLFSLTPRSSRIRPITRRRRTRRLLSFTFLAMRSWIRLPSRMWATLWAAWRV